MHRLMTLIIVLGLLTTSTPAMARILFYDDCEDKWLTGTDWNEAGNKGGNSITLSTEKKRAGSRSYKMVLAQYGTAGTESNVELVLRGLNSPVQVKNFLFNTEYWMGYSVYIPADFSFPSSDNNPGCLTQWHSAYDECDQRPMKQPLILGLNRNTQGLNVGINSKAASCGGSTYTRNQSYNMPALKKGQWNDIVLNFKFSYTSSGFMNVWFNGQQVVKDTGANAHNDAKGPYFKLGIYGHADKAMTVFYDEIRIADGASSYADVAPGGGSAAPSAPDTGGGDDTPAPTPPPVVLQPPALRVVER